MRRSNTSRARAPHSLPKRALATTRSAPRSNACSTRSVSRVTSSSIRPAGSLLSGRIISHYEIGRLLGSGGMGHVYAARDTELGREVALKVASFDGEDAQARLRREAQHASRLSHPHICHIYDVGRADGQLFVVMELVHGRPLSDLVREGQLSIANARRYGIEIADALAHAHEHGVTHRDLKSTNVMITPKRGAKVLDFGLARMLDTHQIDALSHSQRSLTGEGMIAGTLPYMAPELLRGERGDQRSDIWALGVLLYEMVCGRRPFTGATGFEVSAGILHQEPAALPSNVPAPMRAIIQRCLEKNPTKRYQQAADVHLALEEMKGLRTFPCFGFRPSRERAGRNSLLLVMRPGRRSRCVVCDRIAEGRQRGEQRAGVFVAGRTASSNEAIEQFQGIAQPLAETRRTRGTVSARDISPTACRRKRSRRTRGRWRSIRLSRRRILGRGLALAALGRYDEALERVSPDFRVQAFLLSRVGRYREAAAVLDSGRAGDDDAEVNANALLTSAWLQIEQKQYARALDDVRAAQKALAERQGHSLLVLADLIGGVAEIRAGDVKSAVSRLASQKARHDSGDPVESNWVAALEGEIALAQRQYDQAVSSFKAAQIERVANARSRRIDGVCDQPAVARRAWRAWTLREGNRAAAIEEYRRSDRRRPSQGHVRGARASLRPRAGASAGRTTGMTAAARVEYGRFLKLWANADAALPELSEARAAHAEISVTLTQPAVRR